MYWIPRFYWSSSRFPLHLGRNWRSGKLRSWGRSLGWKLKISSIDPAIKNKTKKRPERSISLMTGQASGFYCMYDFFLMPPLNLFNLPTIFHRKSNFRKKIFSLKWAMIRCLQGRKLIEQENHKANIMLLCKTISQVL